MKALISLIDRGVSGGHYAAALIGVVPLLAIGSVFRFVLNYEIFDNWLFVIPAMGWAVLIAWRYIAFEIEDHRHLRQRAAKEEGRTHG